MIRDIIDWTKAYLLVGVVAVPITALLTAPIVVLIDGQALRSDMFRSLLTAECVGTLVWLLTIAGVVLRGCYKKIKEKL